MREAAEASDDVAMQDGEAQILRIAHALGELHAFLLQRQILGMLVRQVEEYAQQGVGRRIESPGLPQVDRVVKDDPSVITTVISW